MTEEQNNKSRFVALELTATAKRINPDITELIYNVYPDQNVEIVIIKFANGYEKRIDVSCDSLLAITQDVLKHL